LASGEIKSMFEEGFEKSTIAPKSIRFLNDNQEMIWWSERSGWGHFYLYDIHGQQKNPITTGTFFADRLVDLDEENRILYFTGMGREPRENLNYRHLYSVRLDGGDLKLLDPGDANHSSTLSPSKKFLIDNFSRVDLAPCSILRNSDGAEVMKLEECDLSRLKQVGFRMPETFVVKAADGITDLFGNLYKPFDFDPTKKYPVITYVYPGPQQEGTRHTFTATAGEQQLAQIGFIVIQVGHRGGTPGRSKAYASFGYFNLRDFGLADKKAAIEQLAQRFSFIDVERVGIYGHSGGGFMTAAALMVPPYNDFFKAGFSTAGNHDNNIYNNAWSERWHGLREVPVEEKKTEADNRATNGRQTQSGPSDLRAVLEVQPEDFFYDYEMAAGEDPWSFEQRLWGDDEPLPLWLQEERQEQSRQQEQNQQQRDGEQKQQQDKQEDQDSKTEQKTRFEIAVPTNAELAANLKHHLFLVHGELDNNVHPANTLRLVDALIKANKKFDMLYLPGTRHGFGAYQPYVTQRMFEFFADRLLLDYHKK
jgi:dipeptidyl aminopeptidase/acylaminoacyl peptidase